jgi:predicted nucleotidyltransferase
MTKNLNSPETLRQRLLLDLKWRKFLKLAKWFRFVPFVKFVMANGSMVLGVADENSDFDVLVAAEEGRIFTVRYILNLIFSALRARRLDDIKGSSPNKLCFNHFITAPAYRKEGLNEYGAELYRNLVPLYGSENEMRKFFYANREYSPKAEMNLLDLRFQDTEPNIFARSLEWLLGGWFGDLIEKKIIEPIARKRLTGYLSQKTVKDRVIISEQELEFHFKLQ